MLATGGELVADASGHHNDLVPLRVTPVPLIDTLLGIQHVGLQHLEKLIENILYHPEISSPPLLVQVSLDKSEALVAKKPSGLSRIQVKEGYFSRISRIRRPTIVRVIEGPTYRSPTYRGTPVLVRWQGGPTSRFVRRSSVQVLESLTVKFVH